MIGIAAFVFAILILFTLYQQYQFSLRQSPAPPFDLYSWASCEKFPDYYFATVTIQNVGMKKISDVKCKLMDKGGLTADEEQQTIGTISPGSEDVCFFTLRGNYTRPLTFEINYDGKSQKAVCHLIPSTSSLLE
jgi:hypothetical protein